MKHFPSLFLLTGAACIGAAALFVANAAHATSPDMSGVADAQLERLFWDCDAYSMQHVLSSGEAALCSMAHEEFGRRRFDGDFGRLLDWWRARKADEHARRGLDTTESSIDPDEAALQAP